MKLEIAIPKIKNIVNKKFEVLYTLDELKGIKIAKGNTGKLLEKIIGLPPSSSLRDFEDGELKTNKSLSNGKPMETMFISQISSRVDELFNKVSFEESWIYYKIKKILYVPVVKESKNPNDWYFLAPYLVEINKGSNLYLQLESDFGDISKNMINDIETGDGFLHTSNGRFIQIRTKDGKPYNPIFSDKYNREISNKNFAFYFKKDFMKYIQKNYKAIF